MKDNSSKIKVLIVDDHAMVRLGLINFLETEEQIEVVGEAANGKEAILLCAQTSPDVVLMDLVMEGMGGIEATKEITKRFPNIKVIVLTSFVEEEKILPALENGALSYLLKTSSAEEIANAVYAAVRNESIIEPKVATKILSSMRESNTALHSKLTNRELEVLKLIGEGKTNNEIAEELFIGIKTVKTHVSNILNKLEVEDRTQAAIYAHRHGLV